MNMASTVTTPRTTTKTTLALGTIITTTMM
jgi:hypothetical protein